MVYDPYAVAYIIYKKFIKHIPYEGLELYSKILEMVSYLCVLAGVAFAVVNIVFLRRQLKLIKETNETNNNLQREYTQQARLIELSHEWSSPDFIEARNHAIITFEKYQSNISGMYEILRDNDLEKWVDISILAHFFVRLSYIQESEQINFKHGQLEFAEPLSYWSKNIILAYNKIGNERRVSTAIRDIHNRYNPKDLISIASLSN